MEAVVPPFVWPEIVEILNQMVTRCYRSPTQKPVPLEKKNAILANRRIQLDRAIRELCLMEGEAMEVRAWVDNVFPAS
jgi:hypothetical protein